MVWSKADCMSSPAIRVCGIPRGFCISESFQSPGKIQKEPSAWSVARRHDNKVTWLANWTEGQACVLQSHRVSQRIRDSLARGQGCVFRKLKPPPATARNGLILNEPQKIDWTFMWMHVYQ